jgi:hypothetical protein
MPPPQPAPVVPAPAPAARTCVNCRTQMAAVGQVAFRTGGWTEGLQPFSLYYCQACGKFDLYFAGT